MISCELLQWLTSFQLLFEYIDWASENIGTDFDVREGIPPADNIDAAKIQRLFLDEIGKRDLYGALFQLLEVIFANKLF